MILDAVSISYLMMPILIPVLHAFNIDPVWYGVIFISALAVGQATPPVGVNLFTAANLIRGNVDEVAKEAIPYVIMDVIVLILLSLLPILSSIFPRKPACTHLHKKLARPGMIFPMIRSLGSHEKVISKGG